MKYKHDLQLSAVHESAFGLCVDSFLSASQCSALLFFFSFLFLLWLFVGWTGVNERTFVAVKPDGVQRKQVGAIVRRFEKKGFKLVGLKLMQVLRPFIQHE